MNSTLHHKLTLANVKRWAHSQERAKAVAALALARAFAKATRERVDAYTRPIFDRYTFYTDKCAERSHGRATPAERITDPKDLYLSTDEAQVARYFDECAEAHAAHGWKGPRDHCPALVAEHEVVKAERVLLLAGAEFLGVDFHDLYGDDRRRAVDLLASKIG